MTGTGPTIVEVRGEELLPDCVAVIRAAFGTVAAAFGLTEQTAASNAAFCTLDRLRTARERGARLFALLRDGQVVGSVTLRPASERPGVLELKWLAVAPPFRHRGYGRALLDHAFALAAREGVGTISIGIIAENERLDRWYRGYGFRSTGVHRFEHLPFTVRFMSKPVPSSAM